MNPGWSPLPAPSWPVEAQIALPEAELRGLFDSLRKSFVIVCNLWDIAHASGTPLRATRQKPVHDVEQLSPCVEKVELDGPHVVSTALAGAPPSAGSSMLTPKSSSMTICRTDLASDRNTRSRPASPSERVYRLKWIFRSDATSTQPPGR